MSEFELAPVMGFSGEYPGTSLAPHVAIQPVRSTKSKDQLLHAAGPFRASGPVVNALRVGEAESQVEKNEAWRV